MGDGETQLNITEAGQIVALQMTSQDTSSVSGKASLPAESEKFNIENPPENGHKDDNDGKNKKSSPKACIIIFIYSGLFACIIGILITSLTVDKLKNELIWDFKLWKWCLLLAIIIYSGLSIYLLISGVEWLIIKFRPNWTVVYYFLGVKKGMVVFIWVLLIFISWFLLFDRETKLSKDTNKIVSDISRGLGGCVIGVAIWLVKTGLVKFIASFHVKILFNKFKSINHRCKILKSLSKKEKKKLESDLYEKEKKEKADKKNVEDLLVVLNPKQLKPLCFCSQENKIEDETGAKNAANEIFESFALPKIDRFANLKTMLEFLEDEEEKRHFEAVAEDKQKVILMEFENDGKEKQQYKAVAEDKQEEILMELKKRAEERQHFQAVAEDKLIKRSVFRIWVVDIFRQYDSISGALKNKKTAVDELNKLASVIVLIIIITVWLLFMEVLNTKTIVLISSQLLLVVFMFGNTAKTAFEAIIFVFVMHPFDVGDRCVVDGVQMIVDEMEVMTTTFLKSDNERIYYPNSVLATKPISNLYRSPNMSDTFEFTVDFSTPKEKLEKLQEEIKKYLEKNSRRWGDHSLQFKEIENMNKLKVALYFNHKINFHDASRRGKRRSLLVLDMKEIFEKLELKYNHLPQPIHLSYTNR